MPKCRHVKETLPVWSAGMLEDAKFTGDVSLLSVGHTDLQADGLRVRAKLSTEVPNATVEKESGFV
jgi:hypothetical protein